MNPVPQPWNGGYLDSVQATGVHDLHLLGWTGDYNDAGNFVGTFFGRDKPEFGLTDPALFAEVARGRRRWSTRPGTRRPTSRSTGT